jgi:serine/threonine-protein phosphatase PP1 catalytic subunit
MHNITYLCQLYEHLRVHKQLDLHDSIYLLKYTIVGLVNDHIEKSTTELDLLNDARSFRVVSDLHGSLASLLTIFDLIGLPSPVNPFIVLGDILDKGEESVEILLLLLLKKIEHPDSIYILKGNHELDTFLNEMEQGCQQKLKARFNPDAGELVYDLVRIHCMRLPLYCFVHNALLVHGCIPVGADNVKNMSKKLEHFMLWTDIQNGSGIQVNTGRGAEHIDEGCIVGTNDVFTSMIKHQVNFLIRGHQYCPQPVIVSKGPLKIVTIASSPYRDTSDQASFVTIDSEHLYVHSIDPEKLMTTIDVVEHLIFAKITTERLMKDVQSFPGVLEIQKTSSRVGQCIVKVRSKDILNILLSVKEMTFISGKVQFSPYQIK